MSISRVATATLAGIRPTANAIDTLRGFIYMKTTGAIEKVSVSSFTQVASIPLTPALDSETSGNGFAIDVPNGFLYASKSDVNNTGDKGIYKINIQDPTFAQVGAILVPTGLAYTRLGFGSALMDQVNQKAYFSVYNINGATASSAYIIRIDLATFTHDATVDLGTSIGIAPGQNSVSHDPGAQMSYWGFGGGPQNIQKVNINPASFALVTNLTFSNTSQNCIDTVGGKLYVLGSNIGVARVFRIPLSNFAGGSEAFLALTGDVQQRGMIMNQPAGKFYVGLSTGGVGNVKEIDIATFTATSTATFLGSDAPPVNASFDGTATTYWGARTDGNPGQIIKVAASQPASSSAKGACDLQPFPDLQAFRRLGAITL